MHYSRRRATDYTWRSRYRASAPDAPTTFYCTDVMGSGLWRLDGSATPILVLTAGAFRCASLDDFRRRLTAYLRAAYASCPACPEPIWWDDATLAGAHSHCALGRSRAQRTVDELERLIGEQEREADAGLVLAMGGLPLGVAARMMRAERTFWARWTGR